MEQRAAADEGAITEADMTREQCGVGHDDFIAKLTVMSHVARGHQEAARAERRPGAAPRGTADRDPFSQHRARTDAHARWRAWIKMQILRFAADDAVRMHVHVRA